MRLVLGQSLVFTTIGVALGAAVSVFSAKLIATQLFGIGAADPATFAVVAVLMSAIALVASAVPTMRATRADPLDAIRDY